MHIVEKVKLAKRARTTAHTRGGILQRIAGVFLCGRLHQLLAEAVGAEKDRIFGNVRRQCGQCACVQASADAVLMMMMTVGD